MLALNVTPDDFRKARTAVGLTTAQVAAQLGMSEEEIVAIEAGGAAIERRTAMAMAYLVMVLRSLDTDARDLPGFTLQ